MVIWWIIYTSNSNGFAQLSVVLLNSYYKQVKRAFCWAMELVLGGLITASKAVSMATPNQEMVTSVLRIHTLTAFYGLFVSASSSNSRILPPLINVHMQKHTN